MPAPVPERPKPHDLATLATSGYLERLGFRYRPATPATLYRHPSKLGLRVWVWAAGRSWPRRCLRSRSRSPAERSRAADSFTPVRLVVTVASKVKRHQPLAIKVAVSADKGALDPATAAWRLRVKLAGECGGRFAGTPGTTVLDRRPRPQPHRGRPYAITVKGSVEPGRVGRMTVCVYLQEQGDNRVFADDTSARVNVVRPR